MNAPARLPVRPALTAIERMVYDICVVAADEGEPMPSNDDITEQIGSRSSTGSTAVGVLKRLVDKGYIGHEVFQRGRQVTIVDTGRKTAAPPNTAPHWRLREDRPPTPAIQNLRQASQSVSTLIEQEARMLNRPFPDFLSDLVLMGWRTYLFERGRKNE